MIISTEPPKGHHTFIFTATFTATLHVSLGSTYWKKETQEKYAPSIMCSDNTALKFSSKGW